MARIKAEKDKEINELREKTMRRPVSLPTGPRGVPNSARSSVSSVSSPESKVADAAPLRLIKRLPLRSHNRPSTCFKMKVMKSGSYGSATPN